MTATIRPSVLEGVQIGLETTSGSAVAASKRLGLLTINPAQPKSDSTPHKPGGDKYTWLTTIGKRWTEASIEGIPTYDEIVYPLASICNIASTSGSLLSGGTAYQWVFNSNHATADTQHTYTVEQGGAVRALKFPYALVTSLTMNFERNGNSLAGSIVGQVVTDGITMTTTPSQIPMIPIEADQVSVYLDDTGAGIGGTQLATLPLSVSWEYTNRFGMNWGLDASASSFSSHVELEPKLVVKLKLIADGTGMGLLTTMLADTVKFMRINCVGGTLGSTTYLMNVDTALKVVGDPTPISDSDGLAAIEWTFDGVYDPTWDKTYEITVNNTQASL